MIKQPGTIGNTNNMIKIKPASAYRAKTTAITDSQVDYLINNDIQIALEELYNKFDLKYQSIHITITDVVSNDLPTVAKMIRKKLKLFGYHVRMSGPTIEISWKKMNWFTELLWNIT